MNTQINPMQIVAMIKNGANPQELMMSYLQGTLSNTPMGANLLNLAKSGNGTEIEQIARNLVAARGGDFNQEFNAFKQQLGIK